MRFLVLAMSFALLGSAAAQKQSEPAVLARDQVFSEFRSGLRDELASKGYDLDRGTYHFVFALCTAGNNSAEVSAAKDIIVKCLRDGLLVKGDWVSQVSFELTPWHIHWAKLEFDPDRYGDEEANWVRPGPLSPLIYKDDWPEKLRDRMGLQGGHDTSNMFYQTLSQLTPEIARSTIFIVFTRSNLPDEPPSDPRSLYAVAQVKAMLLSNRNPQAFGELRQTAERLQFQWGANGPVPIEEPGIALDFYASEEPRAVARLKALVYAPQDLQPLARITSGRPPWEPGILEVTVVEDGGVTPVAGALVGVDGERLRTDGQGMCSIKLRHGAHRLLVAKKGYKDYGPKIISIPSGGQLSHRVPLTKKFNWCHLLWVLLAAFALFFRWRVRVQGESRSILLPLLSPAYFITYAPPGTVKTKASDFVLTTLQGIEVNPGRLIRIYAVFVVFISSALRNVKMGPRAVFGRSKVEVPGSANKAQITMSVSACFSLGMGCSKAQSLQKKGVSVKRPRIRRRR